MLSKGGVKLHLGYTGPFTILGLGFDYGVSKKINVGLRYHRSFKETILGRGLRLVSIMPKVALVQEKLAATLPVTILFVEGSSIWAVSPGLQFSDRTDNLELTLGVRSDIPLSKQEPDGVFLSATIGAGFSRNLDRWAIRPEIGILLLTNSGSPVFTVGLSASCTLHTGKE